MNLWYRLLDTIHYKRSGYSFRTAWRLARG